jgi:hypothetical protein
LKQGQVNSPTLFCILRQESLYRNASGRFFVRRPALTRRRWLQRPCRSVRSVQRHDCIRHRSNQPGQGRRTVDHLLGSSVEANINGGFLNATMRPRSRASVHLGVGERPAGSSPLPQSASQDVAPPAVPAPCSISKNCAEMRPTSARLICHGHDVRNLIRSGL